MTSKEDESNPRRKVAGKATNNSKLDMTTT